jgi:hypothetical protein
MCGAMASKKIVPMAVRMRFIAHPILAGESVVRLRGPMLLSGYQAASVVPVEPENSPKLVIGRVGG